MSKQSSAAGGPGGAGGAEQDEYPDDLWPDEEEPDGSPGWPGRPAGPGQPGPGRPDGRPDGRRFRAAVVVVVAAVAVAAGAGIVLAVDHAGATPAASSPVGQAPGHSGSTGPQMVGPGSGTVPGGGAGTLPGGGSSTGQIMMISRVKAVSRTSITLGGPGRSITAAVTGSTRVSGKVSSISGIKVGDEVSAEMTRSGGRTVLVSIQDPAQAPPGGAP